jgi:polyisoprenoid-binding protein YceI
MNRLQSLIFLTWFMLSSWGGLAQDGLYQTRSGMLTFTSEAPLEKIEARSGSLRGALDLSKKTFAFSVQVGTFDGFNGALQREHFRENYLEIHIYPNATFTGRILDEILFDDKGSVTVRAKGKLNIHGVEADKIIRCTLTKTPHGEIIVKAAFSVLLDDHNIQIPKVVFQKIAEEIKVGVVATLKQDNP